MDIDKAISVLNKNTPCGHTEGLLDRVNFWECEACGQEFKKESLDRYRKASEEHMDAVSAVRDALKQPTTLRDEFAMAALHGQLSVLKWDELYDDKTMAARCYELADAMMEARK